MISTASPTSPPDSSVTARLDSLDVFRGLTMFLMLFVNDLHDFAHAKNVPVWMQHMPAGCDGMTFVDIIFPAFLFGAGLSIPLALGRRLTVVDRARVFRHVLMRSLALIMIGFGIVNTHRFHPTAMPINTALWKFLFFTAVILVWQATPTGVTASRSGLLRRVVGVILLVALAIVYRGTDDGGVTWMRPAWLGILTAIGIAYGIAASGYLLLRGSLAGMTGLLALLTAINLGDRTGGLAGLDPLRSYFSAGGMIGGLPSITVTGVIASSLLFGRGSDLNVAVRLRQLLIFSLALGAAGLLLRPPYGLSKLASTPGWCLLSAAISCGVFAFLYWLVDVQRFGAWAGFVRATGRQPLLAYLLPPLLYSLLAVLGVTWLDHHLNSGIPAILRSLAAALGLVGFVTLLTRWKIALKL